MSEWQKSKTAPAQTTVIAYGSGGMRFMYKDAHGQWRNMMHRPRQTPTHWMPLPEPPDRDAKKG
jgi:hypothetical protein